MSGAPATMTEVVLRFLDIDIEEKWMFNWRTAPRRQQEAWDVNDETYINGVLVFVDGDYYMGYVLEVVDRSTSNVSFVAIATYHGGNPPQHDWIVYDKRCGTFGDRTDDGHHDVVALWGVAQVYEMWQTHDDAERIDRARLQRSGRDV